MAVPPRPPVIPGAPLWLGLSGLLPFFGAALMMLLGRPYLAQAGLIAFTLYGAVILSFLGGIRWGLEIARAPDAPDFQRLLFSVMPSLAAWALAFFVIHRPEARGAAAIFAGLFAAQYMWDRASARDGLAPAWYPMLREVLTGGVMLACLLLILARTAGRV